MTDFHSHILPGVDDGSKDVEMSVAMLRTLAEQGVDRVVATPHFYPRRDDPVRFLERRREAADRLQEAISGETGFPELILGAEVYYFPGISHSDVLQSVTVSGKRGILIEMPPAPWTESMYRELENIHTMQGLLPIVAHVDRYIAPLRTHGIPAQLAKLPVLVQANASFFLNRLTGNMAMRMLKKGQIHLLGSDCHDLEQRPPRLGEALSVIRNHGAGRMLDQMDSLGREILFQK